MTEAEPADIGADSSEFMGLDCDVRVVGTAFCVEVVSSRSDLRVAEFVDAADSRGAVGSDGVKAGSNSSEI